MIINKYNQLINYRSCKAYDQIGLLVRLNLVVECRDRDLTRPYSNLVVKTRYEVGTSSQYIIPRNLLAVILPYGLVVRNPNIFTTWCKLYLNA